MTYFKGAAERRRLEHNDRMSLAWHAAHLNAYAPAKSDKFPPLAGLLSNTSTSPDRPKQSPDQLMAAARVWMANRKR